MKMMLNKARILMFRFGPGDLYARQLLCPQVLHLPQGQSNALNRLNKRDYSLSANLFLRPEKVRVKCILYFFAVSAFCLLLTDCSSVSINLRRLFTVCPCSV